MVVRAHKYYTKLATPHTWGMVTYRTGHPSHRRGGKDTFTDGEWVFCPPSKLLKLQLEHPAGLYHIYNYDRFSPYNSCCYFLLKLYCHTPRSMLSLSLICKFKYLLTSLQSIELIGHTQVLNLSTLHSTLKSLFLLDIFSNRTVRSALLTIQSVRQ